VNAWLIIGTDDSVTIRVAQSEMGEGVFTSMPMLVWRGSALHVMLFLENPI
jgi:hypothetical protein